MAIAALHWLKTDGGDGKLAVAPKPRAGDWLDEEIASWKAAGITTIVCLLEDTELQEVGLSGEGSICLAQGLEFLRFPIPDRGIPANNDKAKTLIAAISSSLDQGHNVVIHCRAGIGRTGLMAAAVLVHRGTTAEDAMRLVSEARGVRVPDTSEQRDWILNFS